MRETAGGSFDQSGTDLRSRKLASMETAARGDRGTASALWFQRFRWKVKSNVSKSMTFEGASKLIPTDLTNDPISMYRMRPFKEFRSTSLVFPRLFVQFFHYTFGLLLGTSRRLSGKKKFRDISTKNIENMPTKNKRCIREKRDDRANVED